MNDTEIKASCHAICQRFESHSPEEAKQLAEEEIKRVHGTTPSVSYSESSMGGMRMFMGMIGNPSTGNTVSF